MLLVGSVFNFSQNKKITFIPHWIPQAQFVGYYVAEDRGFYKKHKLDIDILIGGPRNPSSYMIENEKVNFALLWLTNAIQLRSKGVKVVNIAQVVNHSALMLVAKKTSGIKTPQDFNGKKIGIWGGDFQIQPKAFFKKFNLDVKIVPQPNSINLFFMDGIDVTSAMWYNEYHTIINSGINPDELYTFRFSDYDLNFPEEGIYCLESYYKENYNTCKEFVDATLEGWKYAFENPDYAVDLVLKYMRKSNFPSNRAHQVWMLKRMKDLIFPSGNTSGFEKLEKKDFQFVEQKLKEYDFINNVPSYEEFYLPASK